MIRLDELIERAKAKNASDIHLTVGLPPVFRVDGSLCGEDAPPLTEEDAAALAGQLADTAQMEELAPPARARWISPSPLPGRPACAATSTASRSTPPWP